MGTTIGPSGRAEVLGARGLDERPLTRGQWIDRILRNAIITGELTPGEKLVTERLAQRWDVSPTPLREAYGRLAADGLVELLPQRGARVAPVSDTDARDIYRVRQLLEPTALSLSLEQRDDDWAQEVTDAFEQLAAELAVPGPDLVRFEDVHRDFHQTLISRCGSPWLLRIIDLLQGHSVRYRLLSLEPRGGAEEVTREHADLVDACLRGDVDAATDHLSQHLQLTLDALYDVTDSAVSTVDRREEPV